MKVTTGAPIYLVSACASGEEFVAAFRRYADRNGLFVPIAEPLPAGRRGRFALTLRDGGVMIEGEAEIVSSAKTPSVMHGRIGMTLRFVEPDDLSKIVIGELEKARLAMKPAPPSVPPRPAEVPAQPRPVPPTPAGRIDAVNALAECVAIGELATLGGEALPPKASQKFVVPSIPAMGAATGPGVPGRPRTPSGPAPLVGGERKTAPPPAGGPPARADDPLLTTLRGPPPAADASATRKTGGTVPPPIPPPRTPTPSSPLPVVGAGMPRIPSRTATPFAPMPFVQPPAAPAPPPPPAPPIVAAPRPPQPEVELAEPTDLTNIPELVSEPDIVASPERISAAVTVPTSMPDASGPTHAAVPTKRSTAPSAVPPPPSAVPSTPASVAPVPPVPDDRPARVVRETRKTVMGVAVVPSGVIVLPAAPARVTSEDEVRDTALMAAMEATAGGTPLFDNDPSNEVRDESEVDVHAATQPPQPPLQASLIQPTVEEATPSGDWTMTPGADGPTITRARSATPSPIPADPSVPISKPGPVTGDWMIALDPSRPDGWSEPSKVGAHPAGELPPGPPVSTVASAHALDSAPKLTTSPPAPASVEPKVQIDPTLIEPLQPLPIEEEHEPLPPVPEAAGYAAAPPMTAQSMGLLPAAGSHGAHLGAGIVSQFGSPMATPYQPQAIPQFPPRPQLANASGSNDAYPIDPQASLQTQRVRVPPAAIGGGVDDDLAMLTADARAGKRRRLTILGAIVVALVFAVVIAISFAGRKGSSSPTTPTTPTTPMVATTPSPVAPPGGSDQLAVAPPHDAPAAANHASEPAVPGDAAAAPHAPADAAAVADATDCQLEVVSVPAGADILLDGTTVIATAPATLTLPCGVKQQIQLRKQRFSAVTRVVTPATGDKPLKIVLPKIMFTVKVSSTPAGATITVGTKTVGVTPTNVRLPAFESSTLKITKDGYAPDTQKIAPKQNSLSVHATLKKLVKKVR